MTSHFDQRLHQLNEFLALHHRFPRKSDDASEDQLADWVHVQRARYKRLKPAYRGLEKWVAELESVRGWQWTEPDEEPGRSASGDSPEPGTARPRAGWMNTYKRIDAFAREHGRLPQNADNGNHAAWVSKQRKLYNAGDLDTERAELLSAVPHWTWVSEMHLEPTTRPPRRLWLVNYAKVRAFTEEHGRLPLHADDPVLHKWATLYAEQQRRDELRDTKRQLLERLPGWNEFVHSS